MKHTDLNPASAGNFDGSSLPTGNGVSEANAAELRKSDGGNAVARGSAIKRIVLCSIAVAAIGFGAAKHVSISQNNSKLATATDVALKGVEALAGEDDPPSGAGINNECDCREKGGYWNEALKIVNSGVNSVQCQMDGTLTIKFVTLSGSYKKGKSYSIAWETWACSPSSGNCCIASSQGIRAYLLAK